MTSARYDWRTAVEVTILVLCSATIAYVYVRWGGTGSPTP